MKLSLITSSIVILSAIASAAPAPRGVQPVDPASPVIILKRDLEGRDPEPNRAPRVHSTFGKREPEPNRAPRVHSTFGKREPEPNRAPRVHSTFGKREPEPVPEPEPNRAPRVHSTFGKREPEPNRAPRVHSTFGKREPEPNRAPRVHSTFGKREPEPNRAPRVHSTFGKREPEPNRAPRVHSTFGKRELEERGYGQKWSQKTDAPQGNDDLTFTQQQPQQQQQQPEQLGLSTPVAPAAPVAPVAPVNPITPAGPVAPEADVADAGAEMFNVQINGSPMEVPVGNLMSVDNFEGPVMKMTTDAGHCMAMAIASGKINFMTFGPNKPFDATTGQVQPNVANELLVWCGTGPFDDAALEALS